MALLPDLLAELTAGIEQVKGAWIELAGKQGFAAAGNLYDKLIKTRAAIEAARKPEGSEAAQILARGAGAVAKIKAGVEVLEAREASSGRCARCGQGLPSAPVLSS